MRVTVALSVFLVVVIGLAVAYPSSWQDRRGGGSRQKPQHDEPEIIEGIYPSGRQRPVSTRRSSSTSSNGVPLSSAPFYYFRSPRYVSSVDEDEYLSPYARRVKVFRRQQRDSDEDDDDDDSAADDEDEDDDEPEDDEFNTPTWDEMFPREEQGSYGQAAHTGFGGQGQQDSPQFDLGESGPPQVAEGTLVGFGGQGGPGAGGPQGRTDYQQRRVRPITLRVVKPRQYNNVAPLSAKKSNRYIVYQPQQQGNRQYYLRRHSQPEYSSSGPVRQWAYQPVQHQKPQYVYYQPGRTHVRQPMRARSIWGPQKRSWQGPRRSHSHAHADTWGYY